MIGMRKLIQSVAVIALVTGGGACSRSPGAKAPPAAVSHQVPTRAADNMNVGPGYNGGDPLNVNRDSTPSGVGGGPADDSKK